MESTVLSFQNDFIRRIFLKLFEFALVCYKVEKVFRVLRNHEVYHLYFKNNHMQDWHRTQGIDFSCILIIQKNEGGVVCQKAQLAVFKLSQNYFKIIDLLTQKVGYPQLV
jgi:hypothetical protein